MIIAGEALGVRAVIDTITPIVYQDWTLDPGADVGIAIAPDHRALVCAFDGAVEIAGREVRSGQLAVLGAGEVVRLRASRSGRALLLAGVPHREPVARHGPFVMNTEAELVQAIRDFQSGRMGEITRTAQVGSRAVSGRRSIAAASSCTRSAPWEVRVRRADQLVEGAEVALPDHGDAAASARFGPARRQRTPVARSAGPIWRPARCARPQRPGSRAMPWTSLRSSPRSIRPDLRDRACPRAKSAEFDRHGPKSASHSGRLCLVPAVVTRLNQRSLLECSNVRRYDQASD